MPKRLVADLFAVLTAVHGVIDACGDALCFQLDSLPIIAFRLYWFLLFRCRLSFTHMVL